MIVQAQKEWLSEKRRGVAEGPQGLVAYAPSDDNP